MADLEKVSLRLVRASPLKVDAVEKGLEEPSEQ
jgi:hypothetical protein